MKSANPDEVVGYLNKKPIDSLAILDLIPDTSKSIVSTILDAFINLDNSLQENNILLQETRKSLQTSQQFLQEYEKRLKIYDIEIKNNKDRIHELTKSTNSRINQTTLAKFFLSHSELLDDYSLKADNKLYFKDVLLTPESNQLLYLSLELEQYFGTRNIPLATLLNGIKRYFVTLEKQESAYRYILEELADSYLKLSRTKKRTRVPMSYLRDETDLKPIEIKSVMTSIGYQIITDKNNCIYFVR